MKRTAKLSVTLIFVLASLFAFLNNTGSKIDAAVSSQASATPTSSPANVPATVTNTPTAQMSVTPVPVNANVPAPDSPALNSSSGTVNKDCCTFTGDKKGDVSFDHDAHAFKPSYSKLGTTPAGCVVCHHTDQTRPNLKSERSVAMTYDRWKDWKGDEKIVKKCDDCHFDVLPEGETMPKFNGKEYNRTFTYHVNCTFCHADASADRPELKKKQRFATDPDEKAQCGKCHS